MQPISKVSSVGGAVLVGGASRRMGTNKALVEIDGVKMAQRCVNALTEAGVSSVINVGGPPGVDWGLGASHVPDMWPGEGPLGGIITAMNHLVEELLVVVPCDLIAPSPSAISDLVEALGSGDLAVPVVGGREQWHTSVWRRESLDHLISEFRSGVRSIHRAADGLEVVRPAVPVGTGSAGPFDDADTPAELDRWRRRPDGEEPISSAQPIGDLMSVPQISVAELEAALADGAPLYDVREEHEFQAAHVDGGVLIPLGEVTQSLDRFHDDRRIYMICASGARSGRATEFLRANGFDAVNVAGGTNAWIQSGRPVKSEAPVD